MSQFDVNPELESTKVQHVVGEVALDGSNPTPITVPFENVVAVVVTLAGSAAPTEAILVTYGISAGARGSGFSTVNFYAWGDITTGSVLGVDVPAASAGTATISYAVYGY